MSAAHARGGQGEPFPVEAAKLLDELVVGSSTESGERGIVSPRSVETRREPRVLEHRRPWGWLGSLRAELGEKRATSSRLQLTLDLADSWNLMREVDIRQQVA